MIPADTLILPGLNGSPAGHWQQHWADDHVESRVVEQDDWTSPDLQRWRARLENRIEEATDGVWLVAHSLGCLLAASLADSRVIPRVRGALLVAPCDPTATGTLHPDAIRFNAPFRRRLPFASLVVGSLNDPYMPVDRLHRMAQAWGSTLVDIGEAGHINIPSGFGRWRAGYDFLDVLKISAGRRAFAALPDIPDTTFAFN